MQSAPVACLQQAPQGAQGSASGQLLSPGGRKVLRSCAIASLPLTFGFSLFQETFSPLVGISIALIGVMLIYFGTSGNRRHFSPLIWAIWFNAGFMLALVEMLFYEADYRGRATPLTGAFAFTDGEMWQAIGYMVLGSLVVMATSLVCERVLASGRRLLPTYRLPSARRVLLAIGSWTVLAGGLSILLVVFQIGRTGLVNQTALPFKLAGLLSYSRNFLAPSFAFLILDLVIRSGFRSHAKLMLVSIVGVGFLGTLTALSRGHLAFSLIAIGLYLVTNVGRHGITARSLVQVLPWGVVALFFGIYHVHLLRTAGFGGQTIDIAATASLISENLFGDVGEMLVMFFQIVTTRVGGLQELLGTLSAPHIWQLDNPWRLFLEDEDAFSRVQLGVLGFRTYTDEFVSTGIGFSLWGTLVLSGSLAVFATFTSLFFTFVTLIEEVFFRLGAPAVAQTLAVFVGIQVWGFANVSVTTKMIGITCITYLAAKLFLAKFAVAVPATEAAPQVAWGAR